jgi:hypothetical protein
MKTAPMSHPRIQLSMNPKDSDALSPIWTMTVAGSHEKRQGNPFSAPCVESFEMILIFSVR